MLTCRAGGAGIYPGRVLYNQKAINSNFGVGSFGTVAE